MNAFIAPWQVPPNYSAVMEAGARTGLSQAEMEQRERLALAEMAQRAAENAGRLSMSQASLGASKEEAAARLQEAQAQMGLTRERMAQEANQAGARIGIDEKELASRETQNKISNDLRLKEFGLESDKAKASMGFKALSQKAYEDAVEAVTSGIPLSKIDTTYLAPAQVNSLRSIAEEKEKKNPRPRISVPLPGDSIDGGSPGSISGNIDDPDIRRMLPQAALDRLDGIPAPPPPPAPKSNSEKVYDFSKSSFQKALELFGVRQPNITPPPNPMDTNYRFGLPSQGGYIPGFTPIPTSPATAPTNGGGAHYVFDPDSGQLIPVGR